MKAFPSLIAFIFIYFMNVMATPGDVLELDSSNISMIHSGEWLVELYAPWCGFCRQLAPTFERVASKLKGRVNVAKIDADKHTELAIRFQISGYPTVFHIRDGEVRKYESTRTEDGFVEYINDGWKNVPTIPFYLSPVGLVGEFLQYCGLMAKQMINLFNYLHKEQQLNEYVVVAITLAGVLLTVITVSFSCLKILNFFFPVKPASSSTTNRSPSASSNSAAAKTLKDSKKK